MRRASVPETGDMMSGSPSKEVKRDSRERHCKLCGKKLSSYNVESKYCFVHKVKGFMRDDKEEQLKKSRQSREQYKKRSKNGKKRSGQRKIEADQE